MDERVTRMKNDLKKNTTREKGQGALEYLLLIGGAVLIATIVLLIIISSTGSTNDIINNNIGVYQSQVTLGATGGGTSAVCGNGNVQSGEACDDGDLTNGDGCSSTCTVESGWSCSGNPSACVPSAGNQASSFGLDFTTMNMVIFAGATANNTTTSNVRFTNSSGSPLTITGFTANFSSGTTLDSISIGGSPVWTGNVASGSPVTGLNITIPPGNTNGVTFAFSAATHTVSGNNTFSIDFDFSDTSTYFSPTLQDWSITTLGAFNGSCAGSTFDNAPATTVGAMVTDKGLTNYIDYGIAGDWTITPPSGATAVAFATLRSRVVSVAGTPSSFEYIIPGVTSCVAAGLDDNTNDNTAPGTQINIEPNDMLGGAHFFDVKPFVPSGAGSFQYVMTGVDVDLANTGFRSYNTAQALAPAPPLLVIGYVV